MKHCTVCKAKYDDDVSFCPVDGEVLEDDPSSIVNTVLDGQYQVEFMLGKGGMGAVYRARHILLGDRVAIKILPPEVRNNAEWLRRFRREGQAARRFRHPNAVTVYDLRTASDGTIYMVMEYVEGHTLDAEIKIRGRFTPGDAFAVLEPIMSVLNTAHSMGVVHRDLKPENIMMGEASTGGEAVVKLLDLGIAKMREIAGADSSGTTALTMAGQILGTPYYMSPEQWGELPRDGNSEIDGRADIYSLGLVFYEMIVGRRAYSGLTLHQLRREHVSTIPPLLHEAAPEVPRAFSGAIARATAKDRDDRQSTAGELAAELRAALNTGSPVADSGRTVPDFPYAGASSAQTIDISAALETKSDVNAATITAVESPPTTGPAAPTSPPPFAKPAEPSAAQAKPPGISGAARQQQNPHVSAPRIESADMASSVTSAQAPIAQLTTQPSRGKPLLFVGAGVLILLVIALGIGGFFAVNWLKAKPRNDATATAAENKKVLSAGTNGADATAVATERGRYWLELLPTLLGDESLRVAGVVPLASGQSFKFHFEFSDDGYLYIVGPGEQNRPTAFLTAKPAAISGLQGNQVSKTEDFSFPSGLEHWLELDKKPGTEDYTVIFSPAPLDSPAFLSGQATGKPMTEAEQIELTSFLAKNRTSALVTELSDKNDAQPFVMLRVPQSGPSSEPLVFEIRIQHK
jgi:serine/threonine protein kinase